MKEIDCLKSEFENHSKDQDKVMNRFYSLVEKGLVVEKISKGRLLNVRPFESERAGYDLGKELKSLPVKRKGIEIWHFDTSERVSLVEKIGPRDTVQHRDFYIYSEDEAKVYSFFNGANLNSIALIKYDDGKVVKEYQYARYGFRVVDYNYTGNRVVDIDVCEKEHVQESFTQYVDKIIYGSNNEIEIIREYPNGHKDKRYPND